MRAEPATAARDSLALVGVALCCLLAGRFVQFDDTSGSGSERWVVPLGLLAAGLAAAALGVAVAEPTARRPLGAALGLLAVGTGAMGVADDGFRFVWSAHDGELYLLVVALISTALTLLGTAPPVPYPPHAVATRSHDGDPPVTTRVRPDGRTRLLRHLSRAFLYLAACPVALVVGFVVGASWVETARCDAGGDCEVASVAGVVWAAGALGLWLVAVVAIEIVLATRRARAR